MKVFFMCAYYSQWAHTNLAPRTQEQWDAFKFCRAVKKNLINGTLTFPWKRGPEIINAQNVARAREIFGVFIRRTLDSLNLQSPILIPIPSKDGLRSTASFRSLAMLQEALNTQAQYSIVPAVRFTQPLQPANAGGPRGRIALAPYLTISSNIPDGNIVLVDDIITSGGSILAVCDKLAAIQRAPSAAIVCGHTVSDSLISAFGYHEKEISIEPLSFDF